MGHIPAMLRESLEFFREKKIRTFFDGTLGAGGFAKGLLSEHPEIETYFGCDRDERALELAKDNLEAVQDRVTFIHGNFRDLDELLAAQNVQEVDGFFLTLGCHRCS